ncbi:MAG: putative NBD/HSP70 family sugar kinase [Myxococcota bacterium]|jgi:predicted NBD/HSP70 family sugar kinase
MKKTLQRPGLGLKTLAGPHIDAARSVCPRTPVRTHRHASRRPAPTLLRGPGKFDRTEVRARNERLLLNLIWRDYPVSRAQLSRVTGLSRSTVSSIVGELADTGLVRFDGRGDSEGGRRPEMLGFDARILLLVGVELGATHVSVVVTDLLGQVLTYVNRPSDVRDDPHGALALLKRLVKSCLVQVDGSVQRIVGMGVAVASPVDRRDPGKLNVMVLPKWRGIDLIAHLQATFACPVFVDNDANVGALAELWWGAGADNRDLLYIKVATGIGVGHIVDGVIYRGASGFAGEIGHLALEPGGRPCPCGLDGCLATVAGSEALVARADALIRGGRASVLGAADLDIDTLIAASVGGDAVARRVMAEAGVNVGRGVANLVNLMNPSTIVVGGGLTRAGAAFMNPLRETVRTSALWIALDDADIVTSRLGEREIAVGAATLVLDAALDNPALFRERLAAAA